MITQYTWNTPNGKKVAIMLAECQAVAPELKVRTVGVNIGKDEQFAPDFLAMSPNNKIPAIVDDTTDDGGGDSAPISLFESGAILMYLAEKFNVGLPRAHYWPIMQWLMFQMGGVGPMFGQYNHFKVFAKESIPYAIERYHNETLRLYGVMETQLAKSAYLACNEYTIADMATYPWVLRHDLQQLDIFPFPHVMAWMENISTRPAVQKANEMLAAL